MSEEGPSWTIGLDKPPEITSCGHATHGIDRLVDRYHVRAWCIHFYRYEGDLFLDGQRLAIRPGSVGIIPAGLQQEYRYKGRSEHLYAHFTLRSEPDLEPVPIAAMQDVGRDFASLAQRFEHVIRIWNALPARAEARLWDMLWELSERTVRASDRGERRHSAVEHTCRIIQSRLSEPLSVRELARSAGVSPAHLTRLFRNDFAETVTSYVRKCRLERAMHLLLYSDMPVKQVACDVGIPDLQLFNKTIRRTFGLAPRVLRARGPTAKPERV
jgi:AraC family transcriptional regulator